MKKEKMLKILITKYAKYQRLCSVVFSPVCAVCAVNSMGCEQDACWLLWDAVRPHQLSWQIDLGQPSTSRWHGGLAGDTSFCLGEEEQSSVFTFGILRG